MRRQRETVESVEDTREVITGRDHRRFVIDPETGGMISLREHKITVAKLKSDKQAAEDDLEDQLSSGLRYKVF